MEFVSNERNGYVFLKDYLAALEEEPNSIETCKLVISKASLQDQMSLLT